MTFKIFFRSDLKNDKKMETPFDKIKVETIEELEKVFNYYNEYNLTIHFKNVDCPYNYIIVNDNWEE